MVDKVKYEIEVRMAERAFRIPEEVASEMKGAVSRKMFTRMKREYVNCPVEGREVPFLICFLCPSFLRRVRGVVYCMGEGGPKIQ